jgi:hypothetical protein
VAARTAQEIKVLTLAQALAFIERHGVVCESAQRGAIPSLAEAVAGSKIRGNWWSHPKSKLIFSITRAVRDAPDVLVCRLVDGKITFVHARLWPALVRIADRFPQARLARVQESHSASGRHVLEEKRFPDWVPKEVLAAAKHMNDTEARTQLSALQFVDLDG